MSAPVPPPLLGQNGVFWKVGLAAGWQGHPSVPSRCVPCSTAKAEGTQSPDAGGPLAPRGPRLGPRPLTRTPRAAALRDAEDEIFML